MAAGLMLVLPEIPDSNPSKKVALDYIAAYEKHLRRQAGDVRRQRLGRRPAAAEAVPIAAAGAKPGTPEFRSALRDALEQAHELIGCQGVYNMTPADHSGIDKRGRELMQLRDGAWHLIAE